MKKKIIVFLILVSFLTGKYTVKAADLYSTCFYDLEDTKLLGEIQISKKTDSKGKITYKEYTIFDSEKNKNNDEPILNWDAVGTYYSSINLVYTAQAVYAENLTCPDYMLYVDTPGDELIFVSDKANLTGIISAINKEFPATSNPVYKMKLFRNSKSPLNPGGATSGGTTSGGTTSGGTTSGGTTSGGTTSGGTTSGGSTSSGNINQDITANCNGIFGKDSETKKLIQTALNVIRILAPILALLFSSVDFLKAVAAGAKDDLKAAGTKFLKRLIIVALLFFVPTILNILLDIMENSNGTCGIK